MSERDLSRICFTGEREWNISGAFALAVSAWEECTPTKWNIELSITPLRFAHMLWPPSWLWPGSCLTPPAPSPSYLCPGSSLRLLRPGCYCFIPGSFNFHHPGICLLSSSWSSSNLLNLLQSSISIPRPLLCPPPKSLSVPPLFSAVQGRTFQEGGDPSHPRTVFIPHVLCVTYFSLMFDCVIMFRFVFSLSSFTFPT